MLYVYIKSEKYTAYNNAQPETVVSQIIVKFLVII